MEFCSMLCGQEGRLGGEWYMNAYGQVLLLSAWNYHNIVNHLCGCSVTVGSNSLGPHGLQQACPSRSPGVCSDSCPLNHDATQQSHLLLLPLVFPGIRVLSNESALCIRWPQYWRFSMSLSKEYSGSVFFRIDWLHPHTKSEVKKIIKLGSPEPAELKDREHGGRIPPWRAQGATSLHSKWGQAALCYVSFSNIFFTSKTHCRGVKTSGTSYKNRLHNSDIES